MAPCQCAQVPWQAEGRGSEHRPPGHLLPALAALPPPTRPSARHWGSTSPEKGTRVLGGLHCSHPISRPPDKGSIDQAESSSDRSCSSGLSCGKWGQPPAQGLTFFRPVPRSASWLLLDVLVLRCLDVPSPNLISLCCSFPSGVFLPHQGLRLPGFGWLLFAFIFFFF